MGHLIENYNRIGFQLKEEKIAQLKKQTNYTLVEYKHGISIEMLYRFHRNNHLTIQSMKLQCLNFSFKLHRQLRQLLITRMRKKMKNRHYQMSTKLLKRGLLKLKNPKKQKKQRKRRLHEAENDEDRNRDCWCAFLYAIFFHEHLYR